MSALEGVAVRDSESNFLISPLPQFTNALPSVLGGMAPLPELTEDIDGEEKEEEEISTPDSARHERPIESHRQLHQQQSGETILSERPDHFKVLQMSELSHHHAAPYHRARSHSIPSQSTSSSSPRSASTSPPKLVSHDLTPATTDRASSSYPHIRDVSVRNSDTRDVYTPGRNSNPDGDALRIRLHDLLRDSPTSSSLPNMPSSHFSSSFHKVDRDSSTQNNSPPLSTAGGTSAKTHNPSDGFSHLLASGSQSSNRLAPAPSPSPFVGQRYSSASTEAKKLEEERRRKHLEEKQLRREERYKAERNREDRVREDRHREGHERQKEERHGVDNERPNPIADREHPARAPPTTASSRWDQPISSGQNYIYAAPNSVSPLKRGSSAAGNAYSQHSGVPSIPVPEHVSGQHARYAPTSSGGHRSRPVPIPATNSAHTYGP